jgi:hypothetical protein
MKKFLLILLIIPAISWSRTPEDAPNWEAFKKVITQDLNDKTFVLQTVKHKSGICLFNAEMGVSLKENTECYQFASLMPQVYDIHEWTKMHKSEHTPGLENIGETLQWTSYFQKIADNIRSISLYYKEFE